MKITIDNVEEVVEQLKNRPLEERMDVLLECIDSDEFDLEEYRDFMLNFENELKAIREANRLGSEQNMTDKELIEEAVRIYNK